ncbi:hypothetical protein NHX12_027443, partial [Muraenolepis orangiensis]
ERNLCYDNVRFHHPEKREKNCSGIPGREPIRRWGIREGGVATLSASASHYTGGLLCPGGKGLN